MIFTVLFYLLMFGISELAVRKWHVSPEISRTIEHVVAGLVAAAVPFWLDRSQILLLAVFFFLFLLISRAKKILHSLHNIKRLSYGEVLFPLGIGVAALICLPQQLALYTASVLVLALADTTARLVGERYNTHLRMLKTNIGSMAFFIVAFIIGWLWLGLNEGLQLALVTTIAERISPFGFDNITITAASWLLLVWK